MWGFAEAFAAALPLTLPTAGTIRIPSAAGYAAWKLVAWLDRSSYGEYKDAADLAAVIYWYSKASAVETYLYDAGHGQNLLVQEEMDDAAAAACVLGEDIARVVGPERLAELAERWLSSPQELLIHHMAIPSAPDWSPSRRRRHMLIRALERGTGLRQP